MVRLFETTSWLASTIGWVVTIEMVSPDFACWMQHAERPGGAVVGARSVDDGGPPAQCATRSASSAGRGERRDRVRKEPAGR